MFVYPQSDVLYTSQLENDAVFDVNCQRLITDYMNILNLVCSEKKMQIYEFITKKQLD